MKDFTLYADDMAEAPYLTDAPDVQLGELSSLVQWALQKDPDAPWIVRSGDRGPIVWRNTREFRSHLIDWSHGRNAREAARVWQASMKSAIPSAPGKFRPLADRAHFWALASRWADTRDEALGKPANVAAVEALERFVFGGIE